MDYNLKIKIGDVELLESETFETDGEVTTTDPFITSVICKLSTSLQAMGIGATASNALYFTMYNPYKQSFDGERVELWISPNEDTTREDLTEIDAETGDEVTFEAVDDSEIEGYDDDDTGDEPLTPEELADVTQTAEEQTAETYEFFNGESLPIEETTTDEEEEPDYRLVGSFYVFKQTNSSADNSIRFECLDGFSMMGGTFKPTVAHTTLQALYDDYRAQVYNNFGIVVDEYEFEAPYNPVVNWRLDCSYRDAIGYLAGAVGGYATFGDDNTLGISFYAYGDNILLDDVVISYDETSAGEMFVDGIKCDRSVNPYRDDIIEIGAGSSINFFNPFVTEEMLEGIYNNYRGTRYVGGKVTLLWDETIQAGEFIRIMSRDEYANYIELSNALEEETDASVMLELKDKLNGLGKVLLVSNETINLKGDATSVITSVCDTEYAKENKITSPSDGVFRNLYAEMIEAEYLNAKGAFIADLAAENFTVESINGNVIRNGSVLAAALSQEAVQTLSGNHVYYQAEAPTGGTYLEGDTWYKTVIADSDTDKKVLHIWNGSAWVPSDFDAKILRANTITAQEIATNTIEANNIASGTITAEKINMNDLQTNIARIGDADGRHVVIDNDSVDIMDGANTLASFGKTSCIGNPKDLHTTITKSQFDIGNGTNPSLFGVKAVQNEEVFTYTEPTYYGAFGIAFSGFGGQLISCEKIIDSRGVDIYDDCVLFEDYEHVEVDENYPINYPIRLYCTIARASVYLTRNKLYVSSVEWEPFQGNERKYTGNCAEFRGSVIVGNGINTDIELMPNGTIFGSKLEVGTGSIVNASITSSGRVTASAFRVSGHDSDIGSFPTKSVSSGTSINTTMKSVAHLDLTEGVWLVFGAVYTSAAVTSAKTMVCNLHRTSGQNYYMHTNYSPNGQYIRTNFSFPFMITGNERIHLNARVSTGSDTLSTDSGIFAIRIR